MFIIKLDYIDLKKKFHYTLFEGDRYDILKW